MAEAIAAGGAEATAISALTTVCPPAGAAAMTAALAKKAYNIGQRANQAYSSKTQAERKYAIKMAIINLVGDEVGGNAAQ